MKKKVFSLMMTLLLAFMGVARADELTVNDGTTTNAYVPVYGFYADAYLKAELVQPAADLADMNGATINSIKFYSSTTSVNWGVANFQVFLTEVDYTNPTSFNGPGTVVYEGALSIDANGEMLVTFSTPYTYNGGNLLVGVYNTAEGTYFSCSWLGVSATGAAFQGYSYTSLTAVSGSAKDFLPKMTFDYTPAGGGQAQAASLTLYENSTATNSYVPVYGFYADSYLKCEMVYPATELADMDGGEINSITFYATSPATEAWTGTWQVFMTEVADATIDAFAGPGTVVYEGLLDGTAETMTIDFATPYTYNGGNLLIGFYQTTTGNYKSVTWAGETVTGASISGYSYSGLDEVSAIQRDFLPKVTFDYVIGGEGGDDEDPENPNYTMFAQVWDPDTEEYVQVRTIEVGQRPNGYWMEPYKFQLRNDGAALDLTNIDFTPADFFTLVSPDLEEAPVHMATGDVVDVELMTGEVEDVNDDLTWQMVALYTETRLARIWNITAELYDPEVPDVWELACEEATTFPFTEYPARAHNTTLHDDYNLPYPEIEDGNDAVYKLVFDHDMIISANVDPDNYENGKVALYAEDFNGEGGPMADNNITEFISGGNGAIGGYFGPFTVYENGTTTNEYVPFYGYYSDAYLKCEMVYPQAELAGLAGTTINNMKFYSSTDNMDWGVSNVQVFMKEVPSANISDFSGTTGATVVYTGSVSIVNNEMTINFTEPYNYNGGNLLIGMYNLTDDGDYAHAYFYGETVTGASVQGYSYSSLDAVTASQRNFLPKVTFNDGRNRDEFVYGFENGLEGWTVIDVNTDGGTWLHSDDNEGGYDYTTLAHNGTGFAMCYSFVDYVGAFDTDSYLVSPQKYSINANSTLNFWADNANDDYPESFSVCVATADAPTAADFTTVWSGNAGSRGGRDVVRHLDNRYENWREHTISLSAYAGQEVWIAFHDENYDAYEVWIDDVTITADGNNGGGQGNEVINPLPYTMGPEIIDFPVEPGTYYLVASDTKADFEVNINAQLMPCPDVENFVWVTTPADDEAGVEPSDVTLSWNIPAYATEWRIILGSTYWPELDHPYTQYYPQDEDGNWTWATTLTNSWNVPNDLFNNTNYFWRVEFRNDGACTDGVQSPVFGFTTHLNRPFNLQADDETVFDDQDVTLSWEIDPDRTFRKYYIYRDGVYFGQTTEHDMNATSFVVPADSLEDNHDGYVFTVSAIYDEGESAQSDPITVHVASYGSVSGTVFEQDGETGIAGATVTITGEDIWHDTHTYSAITNADGTYTIEHVEEGIYNGQASCPGYFTQVEPVQGNPFEIFHFEDTNPIDYILDENFDPVCSVLAEYYPDPEDVNAPYVKVSWGCGMPGDWIMEDFEDFENSTFAWVNDATNPWTIIAGGCNEDSQSCMKSGGAGVASVNSSLSVTVNIRYEGVMSFYGKISSEANWDYGYFYIDGVEQGSYTGTSAWVEHTFDITPGTHTFKWSYEKDASVNGNDDCFYIDNIVFYRPAEEQANNRAFSHYRVYRTSCYNNGPYDSIPNAEEPFYPNPMSTSVLSCEVTDTIYIDTYWNDPEVTPAGVYKWGVAKVYAGNRGELVEGPITWVSPVAGNHASYSVAECTTGAAPYCNVPENNLPVRNENSDCLVAIEGTNMGHFLLGDPANVESYGYTASTFTNAACWFNNTYYYAGQGYFGTFDPENGFTQIATSRPYSIIEANPANGKLYGMGTGANGSIYEVNPEDGSYTAVGTLNTSYGMTFTITNEGRFIICDAGDETIKEWDPETDATTTLLAVDFNINYGQDMAMDRETNEVYWAAFNADDFSAPLLKLDLNAGTYETIGYFSTQAACFATMTEVPNGGDQGGDQPINGGNDPIQEPRESVIVWSNCLDKDMYLDNNAVNITVLLNSADSPAGVKVNFTNLIEAEQTQYPIDEVELDETGYYGWDHFRKGDYILSLTNDGYYDIEDTVSIWEPTDLRYVMIEIIRGVENLYVSSTGWAMWDLEGGNGGGQGGDVEGDEFSFGFEEDPLANGWTIETLNPYETWERVETVNFASGDVVPHEGQYQMELYWDFDDQDEWLITPAFDVPSNASLTFWMYGQLGSTNNDHYYVKASTDNGTTWTALWDATAQPAAENHYSSAITVDLAAYAGQNIKLAWNAQATGGLWYAWFIDDITVAAGRNVISFDGREWHRQPVVEVVSNTQDNFSRAGDFNVSEGERHLEYYKVMCESLDHEPIFNANVPADRNFCQVDDSELEAGEIYLCKVAAVYSTGMSPWAECQWQYIPCENYAGTVNGLEVEGNTISWEYPGGGEGPDNPDDPQGGDVTIVLSYPEDIWEDGSGYQMLLDADATACGVDFQATGGYGPTDYSNFEYTVPENAAYPGNAGNIVGAGSSASIQIPAGVYDWVIVNPTPGGGTQWIAAANGNVGGRQDDYEFEAGKTYTFTMSSYYPNDGCDVVITDGTGRALGFACNKPSVSNNADSRVNTKQAPAMQFSAANGHGNGAAFNIDNRDGWLKHYTGTTMDVALGLSQGTGNFYWGVMFPANSYTGNSLTKVSYYNDANALNGQVLIYQGGNDAPGTLLYTQPFTLTASQEGIVEIDMDAPVAIDAAQNLWVVMHNLNGGFVATYTDDYAGVANGSWLSTDGTEWYTSVSAATGGSYDGNWLLAAYVEDGAPVPPTPGDGNVIGAMIFVDGEWEAFVEYPTNSYTYEGDGNEVCVRIVHDGTNDLPEGNIYYSMSCPECEELNPSYCAPGDPIHAEVLDATDQVKIWWGVEPADPIEDWLYYDDGEMVSAMGAGGAIYWAIMFPAESLVPYVGTSLTQVAVMEYTTGGNYTANIYLGGASAPQTLVSTQNFSATGTQDWKYVSLDTPVAIDGTQNLWITMYQAGINYPATACNNTGDANGRWVSTDGSEWIDITTAGDFDYTWMLRGYVTNQRGNGSTAELPAFVGEIGGQLNSIAVEPVAPAFNNRAEIDHFNVYRSDDNVEYTVIAAVPYDAEATYYEYIDTPETAGTYYYKVTAYYDNDCESDGAPAYDNPDNNYVQVEVTGMGENNDNVALYPNPTSGNVTIEAAGMSRITVVSVLGQVVFDTEVSVDTYTLNMAQFNTGMYMVRINTESGVVVKRVTVMQ